jgi:hypothetical protein
MLVLAIDTSWKHGSLALARGDARSFELLETASLTGGAFSAELVPQIAGASGWPRSKAWSKCCKSRSPPFPCWKRWPLHPV